ncbi:MAG: GNAT family N-acetyltransferase [Anaerolineae bacterium]
MESAVTARLPRDLTVRMATLEDSDACRRFEHIQDENLLRRKLELSEVAVAEIEGEMVGLLRLEYLWSAVPYIGLIYVQEGRRGAGVGRALLAFVESYLTDKGYDVLYSSSQANEAAPQAWHRGVGFVECGFIAGLNEGGVGEVFFRKALL